MEPRTCAPGHTSILHHELSVSDSAPGICHSSTEQKFSKTLSALTDVTVSLGTCPALGHSLRLVSPSKVPPGALTALHLRCSGLTVKYSLERDGLRWVSTAVIKP